MPRPRDPYCVLGIDPETTYEEAKGAYRRLAEIFHPDRFTDARPDVQAEAERQMKDLNTAWRTLRARFGHAVGAVDDRRAGWRPPGAGSDRSWAASDDFAARARQARTREHARQRRDAADRARAEDEERARREAAEREAFVREARERLLREEREASRRAEAEERAR